MFVYGKALMRQLHSNPIAVSGSVHTGKQINSFGAVIHMQESPPHERLLVGCSSQPTLHATRRTPHRASRLVQAMPAWLVKTRRAPSRHCSDARVLWSYKYGHAAVQVVSTSYTATPHCGARLALLRGVQRFSSLVDWRSIHCTEVR